MVLARRVDSTVSIAGQDLPVLSWEVTRSNQGSMATAKIETSTPLIIGSGVDIVGASQATDGAEVDIYVGYDGNMVHIFGGVLDEYEPDVDEGKACVRCRDHAAVLADGMQSIAAINYKNQTIGQVVQQIAQLNGFTANVTDPGIKAGAEIYNQTSFTPYHQSYWSLLQKLADDVGYDLYVDPDKNLYFGPEQDLGSINVNYGANPPAENPLLTFKPLYSPRNNSNVTVKVVSYNGPQAQVVTATANAKAQKLGKGRKQKNSILAQGSSQGPVQIGSGSKPSKKLTYLISVPGKSPEQAQALAEAKAKEIAKRQLIVRGSLEGNTDLNIHTRVNVVESNIDLMGFGGSEYNIAELTHRYDVPDDEGEGGGFITSFRAVTLVEVN